VSGATFNLLPTHKLFGFRYITFSAANIHFNLDFSKKRAFFGLNVIFPKTMPKVRKRQKKPYKKYITI
jgi:hypothetical protein